MEETKYYQRMQEKQSAKKKNFVKAAIIAMICILFVIVSADGAFAEANVDTNVSRQEMRKHLYNQVMVFQPKMRCVLTSQENSDISSAYNIGDEMIKADDGLTIDGDYASAAIEEYTTGYCKFPGVTVLDYSLTYRLTPAQNTAYQDKTSRIAAKIKAKNLSDERTVRACFRYVTQHVTYDHAKKTPEISYTGYGAAVKHKAVCYGFAQMFYSLCRDNGIPCRIIIGKVDGGYHSWNIVRLGRKWYICDPTWAAGDTDNGSLPYYLQGTKQCNRNMLAVYKTREFRKSFPISKVSYKCK